MTGVEAWTKMLTQGAKIRPRNRRWRDNDYIHVVNGRVVTQDGISVDDCHYELNSIEWELYAEPTVTFAEAIACVMSGGGAANDRLRLFREASYLGNCVTCKDVCSGGTVDHWPTDGWTITRRGPS